MIGERIREARNAREWSLTDVATKAHISVATLSRIERDKQTLDLGLFLTLMRILELDPGALLTEDDREAVLRRVEESRPDAFAALVRHTYFGYYGHPTVITALGLDSTPVQPRGHQPDPLEPPDLARVTRRGPIYRAT